MEKQSIIKDFQQVDNSQFQILIEFLENVAALPVVKESLALQIQWLDIKPGDHVLDVGSGAGIQALEIAKHVGSTGKVFGTDISSVMVDVAKNKTANSGLPTEFLVAEADSQPFPDHSFDAIRIERVLMYISDTQKVLTEFKRLLKPGGKVVIFDVYWDGMLISHPDKELTRQIIHYVADSFPNSNIVTDLYRQLKNNGFKNVDAKPFAYYGSNEILLNIVKKAFVGIVQNGISDGLFTETEINNWWKSLDEDIETGNFFMSFPGLIGFGMKD